MAPSFFQSSPTVYLDHHRQRKDWVASSSTRNIQKSNDLTSGMSQTKLLFNEAIPSRASNRATRVGPPAPIVIERLLPLSEVHENTGSTRSSLNFTALSEERLQAAVKLAKRDLRRRRHEALARASEKPPKEVSTFETSDVELLQELAATPNKTKSKTSSPKQKVAQHTKQRHPVPAGLSPPTKDTGPRPAVRGREGPLSNEICKLQNELEVYISKVEALAKRGEKPDEPLEAEEQTKLENRRQKQAARSARIIYELQRQVKEVQEEIQKLRSQKTGDTKKSVAINRLAAAHRGALRALQVIIHQLSDMSCSKLPPHYKELGQLIRQLSLCSAKVEVDQGSSVPESALDILQKLETLDYALSKQEMLEKVQAPACPPHRSVSPSAARRGPSTSAARGPGKAAHPRGGVRGRRVASQKLRTASHPLIKRRDVLRAGLERLAQQRELREQLKPSQTGRMCKKGGHTERQKADVMKMRDAGFQQPTVSSRLRVNQLPQKESSVPWIPTSPHSPPPHRSPQRERPEPRCLFSPVKPPLSPPKQRVGGGLGAELALNSGKKDEAHSEALRKAWLDRMTTKTLQELNRLSKEEADRIERLRSEAISPTQWAERAEQEAKDRIQPLLDEAQRISESRKRLKSSLRHLLSEQPVGRAAGSAEQVSEALLEDLLEDAARVTWAAETDRQLEDLAQRRLQAPTLESMLLRMEEIQRDQEDVRRRFASITYSDPLYWDRPGATGSLSCAPGSRPATPQPIRLTRPALKQTSSAEIVLEKPVEAGHSFQSENSLSVEPPQDEQRPRNSSIFPGPAKGNAAISVPGSMLRNIRRNLEDYDSYLRAVAHEDVGGFNPWAAAESLADELLSETLADVGAQFQDVVEEYAEAVFTSEFLQPVQSPPASAAVSQ